MTNKNEQNNGIGGRVVEMLVDNQGVKISQRFESFSIIHLTIAILDNHRLKIILSKANGMRKRLLSTAI